MSISLLVPSDEVRETVCQLIRNGTAIEVAAAATGVELETMQAWLARGARGGKGNGPFIAFYRAVQRARGEAEAAFVGQIAAAASNGNWQAAAWLLERGFEGWTRPSIQPARAKSAESGNVGEVDPFAELDNVTALERGPRGREPR